MGKVKLNLLILMAMVAITMEFHCIAAKDHYVGDSFGWARPNNPFYFPIWGFNQEFHLNDHLIFNFTTGFHTVAEVTLAGYDACDGSNPIQLYTSGPATVSINTRSQHFFICTVRDHCQAGQKFVVNLRS